MTTLGSGPFAYDVVENWENPPDGVGWREVAGVITDDDDNVFRIRDINKFYFGNNSWINTGKCTLLNLFFNSGCFGDTLNRKNDLVFCFVSFHPYQENSTVEICER